MAIAVRGSNGNNAGSGINGSSATVTYPAGVVAGDVVLLFVATHGTASAVSFTTPTNFTIIPSFTATNTGNAATTDCRAIGYYRVATGALSGTVTTTVTSSNWITNMIVFSGVDNTTPFAAAATALGSTTSSTTITTNSATNPSTSNALVAFFAGSATGTGATTWTETTTNSVSLTEATNTERATDTGSGNISTVTVHGLNAGATASTVTGTRSATSADKIGWLAFMQEAAVTASPGKIYSNSQLAANIRGHYW